MPSLTKNKQQIGENESLSCGYKWYSMREIYNAERIGERQLPCGVPKSKGKQSESEEPHL